MDENFSTPPKDKAELIRRIQAAREELEDTIRPLSAEELVRSGPDGGWSVLDHLIHLAEWRWKLLAMIQGRAGYEGLGIDAQTYQTAGLDGINAILQERSRQRPAAEILAEFRRAHQVVLKAIERMEEADLQRVYDLTDPTDTTRLIEGIIANTYGHDLEHLGWIRELP